MSDGDWAFVPIQGQSTYSRQIKQVEDDIQQLLKKINELTGRCDLHPGGWINDLLLVVVLE